MGRGELLALVWVAIVAAAFLQPPLAQNPDYHHFADARGMFGVPNALDVLSNLPFLFVGLLGLATLARAPFEEDWERWPWFVLFAGVGLTAFGSAWYHLAPDNERLVWDRLPMTLGFMGFLVAVLAERTSPVLARRLFGPLLVLGPASVLYWIWTERAGEGDLRPYVVVQFGSLLTVALLLLLYPARRPGTRYVVVGLLAYAAAKGFEFADRTIFESSGLVSGHTLKHLAAAVGAGCLVLVLRARSAPAA